MGPRTYGYWYSDLFSLLLASNWKEIYFELNETDKSLKANTAWIHKWIDFIFLFVPRVKMKWNRWMDGKWKMFTKKLLFKLKCLAFQWEMKDRDCKKKKKYCLFIVSYNLHNTTRTLLFQLYVRTSIPLLYVCAGIYINLNIHVKAKSDQVLVKCPNTTLPTLSLPIEKKQTELTKKKETEKIVEKKTRLKDEKETRQ